jgi:hypothetical protein
MSKLENDIKRKVILLAEYFGCTYEQVMSKSRKDEVIKAKHCIWYYLYFYRNETFKAISRYWLFDHTSIMNGVENIKTYIKNEDDIRDAITLILDKQDLPQTSIEEMKETINRLQESVKVLALDVMELKENHSVTLYPKTTSFQFNSRH